jgi:hypothetical protein
MFPNLPIIPKETLPEMTPPKVDVASGAVMSRPELEVELERMDPEEFGIVPGEPRSATYCEFPFRSRVVPTPMLKAQPGRRVFIPAFKTTEPPKRLKLVV